MYLLHTWPSRLHFFAPVSNSSYLSALNSYPLKSTGVARGPRALKRQAIYELCGTSVPLQVVYSWFQLEENSSVFVSSCLRFLAAVQLFRRGKNMVYFRTRTEPQDFEKTNRYPYIGMRNAKELNRETPRAKQAPNVPGSVKYVAAAAVLVLIVLPCRIAD